MKHKKQKQQSKCRYACYNKLPTKVSQNEFNQCVKPYLIRGKRGPTTKISYYKIFNYILYVLHTGIQWKELKTCRDEISWQTVYYHHSRWSKNGSYQNLFYSSIGMLNKNRKLDLSILHGDGSNVVAKKGAKESAIRDGNIRKARRR